MTSQSVLTSVVALMLAFAATAVSADDDDHSKVLGSVRIQPGEHADGATTVNGSVDIGANAEVKHADTVNGSITVHEHAVVGSVSTVNGSAHIGQGARISENVDLVNGRIALESGADVGGHLTAVNGNIELVAAHVGGGIETTNSDLTVGANSRIEGGILYNEGHESWFSFLWAPSVPKVVIGPGAVVKGPLRFHRAVKLYVSESATIGAVEGATVNRFSGAHPSESDR